MRHGFKKPVASQNSIVSAVDPSNPEKDTVADFYPKKEQGILY